MCPRLVFPADRKRYRIDRGKQNQLCKLAFPDGATNRLKRKKLTATVQRLTQAEAIAMEMVAVEENVKIASYYLHRLASELSVLI